MRHRILLLLLVGLDRTTESCQTCSFPVWSWDTMPAFVHTAQLGTERGDGGFSNEALEVITKFPVVTIEKWQGCNVVPYMYEDDAWLVAAKQIKDINPNITVIVWLDSLRIYTADKNLNPDLKAPCTTGHFRPAALLESGQPGGTKGDPRSPYLLQNSTNQPALEPWSHCHIFDHTKAVVRNFWTDMCLNLTATGYIDGCGADASWQDGEGWHLSKEVAAAWKKGHRQMMRNTTKQLGPEGILLGKLPEEVGKHTNGALHETCQASNITINTLRNLSALARATSRKLLYECHGTGHNDEVAAFLVGVGEYQYYGVGPWYAANDDFAQYRPITFERSLFDRPLGAPEGDAVYDPSTHTWQRKFASGTEVLFNAQENRGVIWWVSPDEEDGSATQLLREVVV